jgi:hypothetical protein
MIAKHIVRHSHLRFGTLEKTHATGLSEPDAIFLCTEKPYVYVSCGGEDPFAPWYPLPEANFNHMLDVWREEEDGQSLLFVKGNMYGIWKASYLDRGSYFLSWDDGSLPTRNAELWKIQHAGPTEQGGRSSMLQISYGDYTSRPSGLFRESKRCDEGSGPRVLWYPVERKADVPLQYNGEKREHAGQRS